MKESAQSLKQILPLIFFCLFVFLGGIGAVVYWPKQTTSNPPRQIIHTKPPTRRTTSMPSATLTSSQTPILLPTPTMQPDNPNTLNAPEKITTSDKKQYLFYGHPSGQNNKQTKKIIFSLPGHGTIAEADYEAWKEQLISNGTYALASINWWDGSGEATSDYYSPTKVVQEIQYFLTTQHYDSDDRIILEGFSRGSANTYAVVLYDQLTDHPVIDGVISASGKYQPDFAITDEQLATNNGKPFASLPWILACGEKDDNPTRDGCAGMEETRTFLQYRGANVLTILNDPNGGHGAFHKSPLKLASQALTLFDSYFK